MSDQQALENLAGWLRENGVRVYFNSPLPGDLYGRCSGFYRSETREVFLAPEPDVRELLLTLAHEAGHWVGYEIIGALPHPYQRERQAYVYGWKVLRLFRVEVTKAEWRWSNIWNLRELQRWYRSAPEDPAT